MRRLVGLLFLFFLSLSVRACVCACVETRTVMISGGNDDKSQTTLRIGRRRHTPVKKEFRRARARAVFSIPRICDLLEPLSQPLFLSISLIQIRDDDDRKSRVMMSACVLSLSLSLSLFLCISEDDCVSLFLLLFVRKKKTREVTNRQKSLLPFFFASPPQKFHRAHTTRITQTHTHTYT